MNATRNHAAKKSNHVTDSNNNIYGAIMSKLKNLVSASRLGTQLVIISTIVILIAVEVLVTGLAQKVDQTTQDVARPDYNNRLVAPAIAEAERDVEASPVMDSTVAPSSSNLISGTTYPFTTSGGAVLEDMSSGTTPLTAPNQDDPTSGLFPIGFEFYFDGARYGQFSANGNGLMRLGGAFASSAFTNDLASATNVPQIAAYWDDLWVGLNGKVHYRVVGSAPNRKLVVEFQNMQVPRVAANTNGAGTYQVWLYETTGVIEFVYGSGIAVGTSYSIGIGSSATQFASVTTPANTVAYGTANNANTAAIATGTKFTFTPLIPSDPTGLNITLPTLTSQTLNWTDTSSNEVGFAIYRSEDGGATYSYVGQTAAGATSSLQSGLGGNTSYSWRVYAVTEGGVSGFTTATASTTSGAVCGTKAIGPSGGANYASLTLALVDIAATGLCGATTLELQPAYVSSVETFPIVINATHDTSPTSTLTIRPQTGATGLSITSANATATIDLNGARFVTIDGRPGGTGITRDMIVENTTTTSPAIRFINDGRNDTLQYLQLKGSNLGTGSGVVLLSTTTGTIFGNSNNTIDNCDLRESGAAFPQVGINISGTAAVPNQNNTFTNNSIANFFNQSTTDSSGIVLTAAAINTTISGNSFFETASRLLNVTGAWRAIGANTAASVSGITITNNFIGGDTTSAGGGPMTFTGVGIMRAIQITNAQMPAVSIQGNIIRNISMTTSSTSTAQSGLSLVTGSFDVGTTSPNTIGSQAATSNIVFINSGTSTAPQFNAMSIGTGTPGVVNVTNNTIGGIAASTSSTGVVSTRGIAFQGAGGTFTISGNTIGSATTANSISNSTNSQILGIFGAATGFVNNISGNTLANLSNTGTGTGNTTFGIACQGTGLQTITGNTIRNLNSTSTNILNYQVVGIQNTSTGVGTGQRVSQNTVHTLSNTNGAASVAIAGIIISNVVAANVVDRNFVHSLNLTAAATSGMYGIVVLSGATGTVTIQNNMVRLGIDASGASITTGYGLFGLTDQGGLNSFYHNSVYIGGTGVVSSTNTSAFLEFLTTGTRAFRDNILANNRQNASGTATNTGFLANAALTLPSPAGLTMSNNVYFSFDPAASVRNGGAGTTYSVGGWQGASGVDASSIYATLAQINFVNADGTSTLADLFPRITSPSAVVDLHIASPTVIEQAGIDVGVLDDFDGQTRASFTPVDVGADAGNFTGTDLTPPNITYTPLANTASTANRVLGTTISDATGVAAGANLPRIYFKKSTDALYVSTQCVMTGGTPLNGTYDCTIDHSLVGGVVTNDTVQYFVVAQDTAGTPNVGSNPGGVVASNVNTVTTPPIPASYNIATGFGGAGNPSKTVCATGCDFDSLTNAGGIFATMNANVLVGNFVVNINGDLTAETGANALNQQIEEGVGAGTFTVTIKPNGGAWLITGTSTGGLIRLNAADRVTIDGSQSGASDRSLSVTNTNVGVASAVVWLQSSGANGATNNTIKNLNIAGNGALQTLIGVGSGSSAIGISSFGTGNNANTYQNNNISKTQYGIYSGGLSAASKNTGTVITQNLINTVTPDNVGKGGILVKFDDGAQITRNAIAGMNFSGSFTLPAFGIALGVTPANSLTYTGSDVTGATVTRNSIDSVSHTGTGSASGIIVNSVTSGTTLVANNMISQVVSNSSVNDFTIGILAGGGTGSTTQIYFNSVSMTGARGAASSPSYGLVINTGNPIVDDRNNIFYNTQTTTSTGKMYAIANGSTTFSNMTSNHNDLFVSGAATFVGQTGGLGTAGTDRLTLADWQTATGQDTTFVPESISADPLFVSITDLHLQAGSPAINAGANGTGVLVDFDGDTRPSGSAPEMGADEIVEGTPGVLAFSSPTYSIGEAGVMATITVTRTGGSSGTVGVSYATVAGGTATGGAACGGTVDYVNSSGTLSFPDTNTSQTFDVPICSDALDEADETVNLQLTLPTGGATIGTQSTAVLTITDDDATPSIAIASPSPAAAPETNVGSHTVTFFVSLSAASGQSVTVHYQTNDGSATTANNDYVGILDTLMTFDPGETSKTIDVTVNGDFTPEPDETFTVDLSTPTNATIGTASAGATILNDDGTLSTFSINDVRTQETNAGTHTVTFTVSLFSPSSPPGFASVQYATGGGTATAGAADPADYMSASGTLNFGNAKVATTPEGGVTQTQTFTVNIIGDVNKEPNETFFVTLSNPINGTIGDGSGSCVINDEDRAYVADFDRDLKTDLSVFRPVGEFVDGIWYISQSTNGVTTYEPFGANGDKIVPGDYDADGVTDFAVFRPTTAIWYIRRSSDFTVVAVQWGQGTDLPVQGDYDGDDKTDIAVFRPSDGTWYVLRSSDSQLQAFQWGAAGDKVVPGDYDGDGKNDFAVFRPSGGTWFVQPNVDTSPRTIPWGQNGDIPVSGDFDGDGSTDIGVFRPSDGNWYISTSLNGSSIILHWGQSGDIPVVGDYDADGISDIAVWRPTTGDWYILNSNDPAPPPPPPTDAVVPSFGHWGQTGDKPVPAAYVPEQ